MEEAAGKTECFFRITRTLALLKNRRKTVGIMVQQKNRKQPHCPFAFEFVFQQKLEWLVARLRRPPGQDKGLLLQGAMLCSPYEIFVDPETHGHQGSLPLYRTAIQEYLKVKALELAATASKCIKETSVTFLTCNLPFLEIQLLLMVSFHTFTFL